MPNTSQVRIYAESLKTDALNLSASQNNSRHQLRVLESLVKQRKNIKEADLSIRDLSAGVVISDYGKTAKAKSLLTTKSSDSDLLLETLQGKAENRSSPVIKKIIQEKFGPDISALLNPDLTTDELRTQFTNEPRLLGFFHELPGFLLIIKDFNADIINEQSFTTQFWSSFAHNGPQKGFWDILTQGLNNEIVSKKLTLHLNTPFANSKGEFIYPNPKAEAILHTIFDRFDQGLEGLPKIIQEISEFKDLQDISTEIFGNNNKWTLEQLDELKKYLQELVKSNPKLAFMGKVLEKVRSTLERFSEFVKSRLTWEDRDGKQTMTFTHPDGTIETLHKAGNDSYTHEIKATTQPSTRADFMRNNVAQFVSRVVRNFKEENRYYPENVNFLNAV
ncbi:MAG: hypothetical protein RLZZ361_1361 [Cyanobacteriota bacterium]